MSDNSVPETPRILNLGQVELGEHGNGEGFAARLGRVGARLGARQLGCTLVEVPPGKKAWPYHLHMSQEEMFVVLEGQGTWRYDGAEYPVEAGSVMLAPTGAGTAHQIINTSSATLRYLAFSSNSESEVCLYPDSGKLGAYAGRPGERAVSFVAAQSMDGDYWEGES